ncbi:MAG: tripartite tricarboxylate transporter TctB family protein [Hyphomicrobiales bacterium]|nr:MAG: tripartite tricarboxylate transporter TctB family protein [Hyphomicrobiales bacterium]
MTEGSHAAGPARLNVGEIVAAVLLTLAGLYVAWEGTHFPLGTVVRMGPGFVPVALGLMLAGIGVLLTLTVARSPEPTPKFYVVPVAWVCSGLVAFGLLAERFGLVPATAAMVVLCALAERPVRLVPLALLIIGLSALGAIVFVEALKLPMSIVRW